MNYAQLYKHKKLHHIYCDKDGNWHVVSYPIIYMNQKLVYFKQEGSFYIDYIGLPNQEYNEKVKTQIENQFYSSLDWRNKAKETSWYFNAGYFFDIDVEDAKQFCKKLSEVCKSKEYIHKSRISQLEGKLAALDSYVKKYEEAKAELDKLKSEETT